VLFKKGYGGGGVLNLKPKLTCSEKVVDKDGYDRF